MKPQEYYQTLQITSLKQAIESPNLPLAAVKNILQNGEVMVKAVLVKIIEDIVLFINVGKTMNAAQVVQTAELIFKDFYYFKIDDFKLMFENAKRGFYGKQYDRLDGQIIYEWCSIYAADRANEAERLNNLKALQQSNEEPNPEGQQRVITALKQIVDAVTAPQKQTEQNLKKEHQKLVDLKNDFIQQCFFEFDTIHKNNPVKTSSGRFIMYNGNPVDQIKFTELKLEEFKKTCL